MPLSRLLLFTGLSALAIRPATPADRYRIITLDPGHFHAALIQKQLLPELATEASVYAPLGSDLLAHLGRVAAYNARKENPTEWRLRVYAAPDYWERMLAERPGEIVVLSGANYGKIDRMSELVRNGLHILADKPWIIESEDFPKLAATLDAADRKGVIAYDGMTQRFEISCILQRELVNDENIFGKPIAGSPSEPGVYMESVHYLLKMVSGAPNRRPPWFFDVRQLGEGLTDVGTHLVDLVQWILYPNQAIDYRADLRVLAGSHWPTVLSLTDFQRVTGESQFPDSLRNGIQPDVLHDFCNNSVTYTIRGIHTKLDVKWGFEAAPGAGDTETAIFRGSQARVEVRQGKQEGFRPEVFVIPSSQESKGAVINAVREKLAALAEKWPGLGVEDRGGELRILIPDGLRIGHEAHFAVLVETFLRYVKKPNALPAWEKPNMLAKYFVTTQGVRLAREAAASRNTARRFTLELHR